MSASHSQCDTDEVDETFQLLLGCPDETFQHLLDNVSSIESSTTVIENTTHCHVTMEAVIENTTHHHVTMGAVIETRECPIVSPSSNSSSDMSDISDDDMISNSCHQDATKCSETQRFNYHQCENIAFNTLCPLFGFKCRFNKNGHNTICPWTFTKIFDYIISNGLDVDYEMTQHLQFVSEFLELACTLRTRVAKKFKYSCGHKLRIRLLKAIIKQIRMVIHE